MKPIKNPEQLNGNRVEIFTGSPLRRRGIFTVRRAEFGWCAETDDKAEVLDLSLVENAHYAKVEGENQAEKVMVLRDSQGNVTRIEDTAGRVLYSMP